jgi:hypothetical protein|tara:strand:- start:113 stop:382 length:270 start_codon:yes stop_codon:yes gene_type:complete
MNKIVMTQTNLTKNPDTKTTYLVDNEVTEEITPTQYRNITSNDTLKWFRRLGGSETAQRSYTCRGYNITKLTSISPDKQSKTIRQFKFN